MIEKIEQVEIDTMKKLADRVGGEESIKLAFYIRLAKKVNEIIEYKKYNDLVPP
jgi:hypothetical protein